MNLYFFGSRVKNPAGAKYLVRACSALAAREYLAEALDVSVYRIKQDLVISKTIMANSETNIGLLGEFHHIPSGIYG